MAKTSPKKLGRKEYLGTDSRVARMAAALLDSPSLNISFFDLHAVQHTDAPEGFYCYITLRMGELTEERYDALRAIVNGAGGVLNIPAADKLDAEGGNVRIWLNRGED